MGEQLGYKCLYSIQDGCILKGYQQLVNKVSQGLETELDRENARISEPSNQKYRFQRQSVNDRATFFMTWFNLSLGFVLQDLMIYLKVVKVNHCLDAGPVFNCMTVCCAVFISKFSNGTILASKH